MGVSLLMTVSPMDTSEIPVIITISPVTSSREVIFDVEIRSVKGGRLNGKSEIRTVLKLGKHGLQLVLCEMRKKTGSRVETEV
jgi:hypothetical protein